MSESDFEHLNLQRQMSQQLLKGGAASPSLMREVNNSGVQAEIWPDSIALGVPFETLEDPLLQEEILHLFTVASLLPLRFDIFPIEFLDDWLKKQEHKNFAVVVTAGSLILNTLHFTVEVLGAVAAMQSQGAPLMGHLSEKNGRLPYLHEQFLILDLNQWRAAGQPSFGQPYKWFEMEFGGYATSGENIHDTWTPTWLEGDGSDGKRGRAGFGTQVLSRFLGCGCRVINVPFSLRDQKKYAYPRDGRGEQYQALKAWTRANDQTFSKDYAFVFNTEKLGTRDYALQAETLLAPCAGFKPLALVRSLRSVARVVFVERSPAALKHYRALLQCPTYNAVLQQMCETLSLQGQLPEAGMDYVEDRMQSVLQEGFEGSADELLRCLRETSACAHWVEMDYHHDSALLLAQLHGPTLFWHSNAWNSNNALFRARRAGLRQNYIDLVRQTAERLGTSAWIHQVGFEAVFGEDFAAPRVVFTSGLNSGSSIQSRRAYLELERFTL